ncbi:hypothetical protein CONPUDRAFT_146884, partial [Coniophora puteana RWD-64-598 SS2]
MPIVTTLLDDQSPLIQYNGIWGYGGSAGDVYGSYYYLGTYTVSNRPNNQSATFTFKGTGFTIYGSNRGDHGLFQVSVDGETYQNNSENAAAVTLQQVLLTQTNLTQGELHNVTITNLAPLDSPYLDVDFVTWETPVGEDDQGIASILVQDTDPSFDYQPADAWSTNPSNITQYKDGTGHITSTDGAYVAFTLTGDVVNLYGSTGPECGNYSISLDEGPASQYNASRAFSAYQNVIYHANNLGPGTHKINVTNNVAVG